jgi:hypothetical protein
MHVVMTSLPFGLLSVVIAACAACGPETTSFRTTDKSDDRPGPPAAAYDVRLVDQPVALVHVWSNGGYISSTDEPMTHIGFEIRNVSTEPVVFDGDALELMLLDHAAMTLPPARFTTIAPLGPSQIKIKPGATVVLGCYFMIPVRPHLVHHMRIRWALRTNGQRYDQTTSFTRADDAPVIDYPRLVESRPAKPTGVPDPSETAGSPRA